MNQKIQKNLCKSFLFSMLLLFSSQGTRAATGDTIIVHGFNHLLHQNCNTGDSIYPFPPDSMSFYKILLRYELSCPPGGCDIYDRIATLKVMKHTGVLDSTITQLPSFRSNGNIIDSLQYVNDTSYSYSYNATAMRIDSTPNSPITVLLFNNSQQPLTATDTLVVWPAYYNQYHFDANGHATDSMFVTPDSVLHLSLDTLYTPYEVREPYEIARAITPYGQAVTLWFDVSDYRPLLHDTVDLNSVVCGYSNGWNVTTDFYFIEGIPPMHPYKITNLWNGTFPYGNPSNPIDSHLQPITLHIDSQSVYELLRLRTTGHGFGGYPNQNVAEFFNVFHTININGTNFQQHLWRDDCGRNPLYAQGAPGAYSTWYYNRANWCPGSYVTPHDYYATPQISHDTLRVDYNLVNYTVTGGPAGFYAPEYYIQSHEISYDNIAYINNAAVLEVKQPNGAFEYNRMNPVCDGFEPKILIKNYGRDTLTSLTIHYGVDGNLNNSFVWTGSLSITDTENVSLPPVMFGAGAHTFEAYVDLPNGAADEFIFDDTIHSNFNATNIYNASFVRVVVKTDQYPAEISWQIKDEAGSLIASRSGYTAVGTTYTDTVSLSNGCYNFTIRDAGGDGLCCFTGSGFMRLIQGGTNNIIATSKDYGEFYSDNFSIDLTLGMNNILPDDQLTIYPNPAKDQIILNTSFESSDVEISLMDMTGKNVMEPATRSLRSHTTIIELPKLTTGLYFVRIKSDKANIVKKIFISQDN